MIHKGPLSEHPYNTSTIAGIWETTDAWGEPEFVLSSCQYPVKGVLKETEKAKLIQLNNELAVWIPKKVIEKIVNNVLHRKPVKGYHFGGLNDEFFVKLA